MLIHIDIFGLDIPGQGYSLDFDGGSKGQLTDRKARPRWVILHEHWNEVEQRSRSK